jgi:hypothetical protein
VPESFTEPPLDVGDVFFVQAFLDLQTEKTQFREIPWSAFDRYATRYNLGAGIFEKLVTVVSGASRLIDEQADKQSEKEAARKRRADEAKGKKGKL